MISKKQVTIRCICLVLGLVLGISTAYLTWKTKEYFYNPKSNTSRIDITELEKSGFWEKITIYGESQIYRFLDSYERIYNCNDLSLDIDSKLVPYFEKYGYTSMLVSGLKSDNKFANVYCIEKCCELYGERLYDNKEVLSALNSVKIDKNLLTDDINESTYIYTVEERLNLAKSLLDGSYSSDKIIKNKQKTRMVWVANLIHPLKSLKIYDYGFVYTSQNQFPSDDVAFAFVSDDTIVSNDGITYTVFNIRNSISEYNINDLISNNINDQYIQLNIKTITASDDSFSVLFNITSENYDVKKYKLTSSFSDQSIKTERL